MGHIGFTGDGPLCFAACCEAASGAAAVATAVAVVVAAGGGTLPLGVAGSPLEGQRLALSLDVIQVRWEGRPGTTQGAPVELCTLHFGLPPFRHEVFTFDRVSAVVNAPAHDAALP
eukprot:gene7938-38748_t